MPPRNRHGTFPPAVVVDFSFNTMNLNRTSSLIAAQLSLALLIALPASADYKQMAQEQTDYIQAHFFDAKTGRYKPKYPVDPKELPFEFMWGNGVQLTVLVAAAKADPTKYKPWLYAFQKGLEGYWDPASPVPGYNAYCSGPNGTDKYYDDNQWIVLADTEAFETTKDRSFLKDAYRTQNFVLSGWDEKLGGGIYWDVKHKSKNTCSNAPAAASALRLYQLTKDKEHLKWATKIRDWTKSRLRDEDGLYWDNINLDGKVEKTKWSYNTALMIRTDVLFYQLTGDKASLASARKSADAGIAAWTDPATGSLHKTDSSPIFTHLFCEALLRLYDVTKEKKYLEAAQKEADFSYRVARDPQGGYWNDWNAKEHQPDEKKKLIVNASAARLFWLLASYPEPKRTSPVVK